MNASDATLNAYLNFSNCDVAVIANQFSDFLDVIWPNSFLTSSSVYVNYAKHRFSKSQIQNIADFFMVYTHNRIHPYLIISVKIEITQFLNAVSGVKFTPLRYGYSL